MLCPFSHAGVKRPYGCPAAPRFSLPRERALADIFLRLSSPTLLRLQTSARSFLHRLASDKIEFDVFSGDLQKRYWKYPFQVWGDARNKRF